MPKQLTKDAVLEIVKTSLCLDDIKEDQTFDELGLDELDIVEMTLSLEGELEIDISENTVMDWHSVEHLLNWMKDQNLIIGEK